MSTTDSPGTSPAAAAPEGQGELRHVAALYQTRFSADEQQRKRRLWRILCQDFFQRYIAPDATVVDLGAGYCEFINEIRCRKKYAVDLNEDTPTYAGPDVEVVRTPSTDLSRFADGSVDAVFASNFFEHLPTKAAFLATLAEVRRVLRPGGGRLLVLQPNIRLLNGAYWDFVDHHLPLTERTLAEAFALVGLETEEMRTRFLPYTTKSRLPQWSILVRGYLRLAPLQWLLGKQTWAVARRP